MIKIAKTENGLVRGIPAADPRIISFKGIPFAAPPVGENRWRAPQPASDWKGVRDCLEFAPIPMQSIPGLDQDNIYTREWNVDPEIPMSEDCLYLNVWTPAESTGDKLPVYVWYFGGALQWGNTAEMEFDGERLARRGIIVVTVSYRLNVFGFLAHPELIKEAPNAPANFGNLDQQYGLFWTKRNIEAFGGDPDNITIGGQSAGGGSVLAQLNCPANKGYFQKAIIQSGIVLDPFQKLLLNMTYEEEIKQGQEFFSFLGINSLEEGRALDARFIRDKNDEFNVFWGTVVDGIYQTDTPWNHMKAGKLMDIPIMMGYTNNEFLTSPQNGDQLVENNKEIELKQISSIELGVRTMCKILDEQGSKGPNFVYEFGSSIPGGDNPGAFHSSDLWFFFETLAKCWRPFEGKHYNLARLMCNYWAAFIKNGNPNGLDADGTLMEYWEHYTDQMSNIMTFYDSPRMQELPEGELMGLMKRAYIEGKINF